MLPRMLVRCQSTWATCATVAMAGGDNVLLNKVYTSNACIAAQRSRLEHQWRAFGTSALAAACYCELVVTLLPLLFNAARPAVDEEPPVFLAYQAYKGPANIPHVPGEFFGAFFLAINVRPLPPLPRLDTRCTCVDMCALQRFLLP
jgi:hypothetical protein